MWDKFDLDMAKEFPSGGIVSGPNFTGDTKPEHVVPPSKVKDLTSGGLISGCKPVKELSDEDLSLLKQIKSLLGPTYGLF